MKLCELFDDPADTWKDGRSNSQRNAMTPQVIDAVGKARQQHNHKFIGAGLNAYVGTDDADNFGPVQRIANDKDGGSIYLSAIAEAKSTNPFFPKVQSITHDADASVHTAIIERLIPFETESILGSIPLMKSIWESYFTDEWQDAAGYEMSTCFMVLNDAVYTGNFSEIKDAQLKEALKFIRTLATRHNLDADIHERNFTI